MSTQQLPDETNDEPKSDSTAKPDPGTLHTTDPQEHMEGPLSSLIKKTGEGFESKEDEEKKEETSNS